MPIKGKVNHIERLGEIHSTKQGYEVEIIEYSGSLNCTIKFLNKRGNFLKNIQYDRIIKGTVINPYHPNKYKGYMGEGRHKSSVDGKCSVPYKIWSDMLKRVYSEVYHKRKPTYKDVTVCEEWHNFQNFANWYEENCTEGWRLDKDIICPECKIYSPETCDFVPDEINGMFISSKSYRGVLPIGVKAKRNTYEAYFRGKFLGCSKNDINYLFNLYKTAREKYTKEIAEKYKGRIKSETYYALMNYEVKITD